MPTWYHSAVLHGDKQGRKISFPTINLDPKVWPENQPSGVYSALVKIIDQGKTGSQSAEQQFMGALYYGPRSVKQETHNVLEIFLLDFPPDTEIYGQQVSFYLQQFLRPVIHFHSFAELQEQIAKDVANVRGSFGFHSQEEKAAKLTNY